MEVPNAFGLKWFIFFQIVECFPHTMPKDLPELIQKSKWSKPAKEVETWDQWWAMHQKILKPLQKTAKIINSWWSFTGIFGTRASLQLQFFISWFYKMKNSRKHPFLGRNKQANKYYSVASATFLIRILLELWKNSLLICFFCQKSKNLSFYFSGQKIRCTPNPSKEYEQIFDKKIDWV